MNIKIEIYKKLDKKLKEMDKAINDDAFSELLFLSELEKKDFNEKYKVNPWRFLFLKIENTYIGRVVLDKRYIKVGNTKISVVGINGLAITKANQKLGYGSKLLLKALELCKTENIDSIFLNASEELHEYYKRFGFEMKQYKFQGRLGTTYLEEDGMVLVINKGCKELILNNDLNVGGGNV